ncbi:MAG TPA: hypothetical protein VLT62_29365 [Candidatus Methylomirabilis sp.]|nr:hypothetical protein [Candidatus Methylomirabilis sp.]HSB82647.1 hypothetical protein [Candidatus Methylomirabilis sp.]
MQKGIIRRRGESTVIGHWQADLESIVVETEVPELRRVADEILKRPQTIPIHAPERHEFAGGAVPLVETPSTIKFLALFALEMEERGFELDPEDE